MNISVISGRIPFEIKSFGSDENPVIMFTTGVQRSYKKEGEKYYPEDLINCKAFGHTAKFIKEYFNTGDVIELIGEIRKDDNYEKDGKTVYGQLYFHVNQAKFVPKAFGDNDNSGSNNAGSAPKKESKSKAANPFGGGGNAPVDPFGNVPF